MARPRLTYLSEEDRAFVHEQALRVLADDVAAEIDAVIGRSARSVGASPARVSWRGAS